MSKGPQAMSRDSRMKLAQEITERVLTLHADILAVGLYGSMARGTDGPYSDVEMLCVLPNGDEEYTHEWSYGPGKAEVNFCSQNVLMQMANEVDVDWPLTHGAFCNVLARHETEDFFFKLRETVLSQPQERFNAVIHDVIVGELYERVGKLRNARHAGHTVYLPKLAVDFATDGAYLIGLDNRYLYSTGARVLEEALTLPGGPAGYDALCRLVIEGDLRHPDRIHEACESFWSGIEVWATERSISIDESCRIPF